MLLTMVLPLTLLAQSGLPPEAVATLKSATVMIANFEDGYLTKVGTGAILEDGVTVVTSASLVLGSDDDVDDCKMVLNSGTGGETILDIPAQYIKTTGVSPESADFASNDIAVIRLPKKLFTGVPVSAEPIPGETSTVYGLGFPGAFSLTKTIKDFPTVTVHTLNVERIEKHAEAVSFFVVSGSLDKGDIGAPIVSPSGKVLGIFHGLTTPNSGVVVPIWKINDAQPSTSLQECPKSEFFKFPPPKPEPEPTPTPRYTPPAEDSAPPEANAESIFDRIDLPVSRSGSVAALTTQQLQAGVNELYARHGYIFTNPQLQAVFSQKSWYSPKSRKMSVIERSFTAREKRNLDIVLRWIKVLKRG